MSLSAKTERASGCAPKLSQNQTVQTNLLITEYYTSAETVNKYVLSVSICTHCFTCQSSTLHAVGAGCKANGAVASGRCQICRRHKFIGRQEFDKAVAFIIEGGSNV